MNLNFNGISTDCENKKLHLTGTIQTKDPGFTKADNTRSFTVTNKATDKKLNGLVVGIWHEKGLTTDAGNGKHEVKFDEEYEYYWHSKDPVAYTRFINDNTSGFMDKAEKELKEFLTNATEDQLKNFGKDDKANAKTEDDVNMIKPKEIDDEILNINWCSK